MYPTMLSIGLLAAILWLTVAEIQAADGSDADNQAIGLKLEAAAIAFLVGLLFSRLSFVLLHLNQYRQSPLTALAFWQGGLTAWGAALGLLLGLFAVSLRMKTGFWRLADALAGPASLVALSAWLGCALDGCAYGRRAAGALLAVQGPDLTGAVLPRWPTQSIGALGSIGLLAYVGLDATWQPNPGLSGIVCWLGHSLILLGLSWLRADPIRYFGGLRSDTLGAAIMLLIGLVLAFYWWRLGEQRSS